MTNEEKFTHGFSNFLLKFGTYEDSLKAIIKNRNISCTDDINLFLKDFDILDTTVGNDIARDLIKYVG